MSSDDKAAAIVGAATTLFSRYGFKRTSVDDVAREAGIAKGTVYLYFPNKDAIFGAVCEAVGAHMLALADKAVRGKGTLVERLTKVLEAKYGTMLALVDSSPHAAELMDSSNAYGAEALARTEAALHGLVADLLAAGHAAGELDLTGAGLSAADAADIVIRAAAGAAGKDPDGTPPTPAEHKRRLRRLAAVLVRGLAAVSPAATKRPAPTATKKRAR